MRVSPVASGLAPLAASLLLFAARADAQALAVPSVNPASANAVAANATVYDQSADRPLGKITNVGPNDRVTMTLQPDDKQPAKTLELPKSVFFVSAGKVSLAATADQLSIIAK